MDPTDRQAPELRVQRWIDKDGADLATPLKLADMGAGPKIIFAFQHWCPGCHHRGFPTLRKLYQALGPKGVGFAVIQTVFEGARENTFERLRTNQLEYGLPLPFGHDVPLPGEAYPTFMADYGTGGTPWFVVIDTQGQVVFSDFRLDADRLTGGLGLA